MATPKKPRLPNDTSSDTGPIGNAQGYRAGILKLRELALGKIDEAFGLLWSLVEQRDPVAMKLYFTELLPSPKRWLSVVQLPDVHLKKIKTQEDVNSITTMLIHTLLSQPSICVEEVMDVLKIINKITDTQNTEQTVVQIPDDASLKESKARLLEVQLLQQQSMTLPSVTHTSK